MAQIVIDIPDFLYEQILKKHVGKATIARVFKNGTPLPKGHGRLVDASNLMTVTDYDGENEKTYITYDEIENAPTIIEADEGVNKE